MTEECLKTVTRHFQAFAADDRETFLATYADDAVVVQPDSLPWGGAWRGRDQIEALADRLAEHVPDLEVRPENVGNGGSRALVLTRYRGTTASGRPVDLPVVETFLLDEEARIKEQQVFFFEPGAIL